MILNKTYGFTDGQLSAPQANAMAAVIEPLMSEGGAPWLLYGIGALVALALNAAGIEDVLTHQQPKISYQEAQQVLNTFFQELEQKIAGAAKEAGEKFLAENAKREGVKVTESGLQYEILEPSLGQKPKATDTVRVHYEGTLIDGTVFDSSYKRGESITFPLNGVIKGWTEGLQLMSIGSKYKFFIPYQLAYGERGAGASIPPCAALIFTVELLGIE